MKAEELDAALAHYSADAATGSAPGTAIPIGAVIPRFDSGANPSRLERAAAPATVRIRAPRCVPGRYAVRPADLQKRLSPALLKAIDGMDPAHRYGALFLGPSGCGKSSAAAFVVQRWRAANKGGSIYWLDAIEATDVERRYKLGSGEPGWLTQACTSDWLVLDDVGKATAVEPVQTILARRYRDVLPTIVTTGLEKAELAEHLGAAMVRRMVEYKGRTRGVLVDCRVEGK